jgi:phosphatidylglycerophosphate synthase
MKEDLDKQDNGPLVPLEQWMGREGLKLVPQSMTANQVTLLSGSAGILAAIAFYLASFNEIWFVVGALLVLFHWAADNVDGHVARTRNQASPAGRFLDIFIDSTTFCALGIGLAFASYTHFQIVAVATLLCLLQYVLTALWIALTKIWPFPTFGPAEANLTLIIMALLMIVLPVDLVTVMGYQLSLIDIAFALTIPASLITLAVSSLSLFRHLQGESARASELAAVEAEAPKPALL